MQDPVIGQSRRNANGLITAMYAYANDHRLALPPSLGTLTSDNYVTDLSLFVDPRLGHVAPDATGWTPDQRSAWVDANADYDYRPSDRANASNLSPNVPLIFERANDLDAGRLTGGLVIGFGGGDTVYQEARWARETLAAIGAADPRMGVLMGSVFDDVDGDGTPQSVAAEPIVSGYTVFVDLDRDGVRDADEPSQISVDGAGFRFDGLARGTYTIRVDATASQRTTRAAMAGVSEATPGASGLLVGVHDDAQLTTLTGVAFDDANANGTRDAGQAGATYATAYVDLNGNGKPDAGEPTGVPDAATARFVLRIPNPSGTRATYTVRLSLPAGATQIAPAASAGLTATAGVIGSVDVGAFAARRATSTPTPLAGTPIGTAGSYQNAGNTIARAFDGDLSTFFDGPAANGNVVGLDLGSARTIAQIKFAPRVGYAARMVGGLFQGSNDAAFATATTLYTIAAAPAVGALTTANLSNATAYRYVRYVAPAGSYGNVAELQFFGAAATTTPAKLAGTTIGTAGSYNNNGNTIGKATDGDLNTFFDGAAANGNVVGLDLGTARVIRQIAYAPRNGFAARMIGGVFQGSNDAAFASATTLLTITAAPATGVLTMATITNATAYRYVRYVAPPGSYGNVGEVQFFG